MGKDITGSSLTRRGRTGARRQEQKPSAQEIVRGVRRGERNPFHQGSPEGIAYAFTEQLQRHAGGRGSFAHVAKRALDGHDPRSTGDMPPVPGSKPLALGEELPPLPGEVPERPLVQRQLREDAMPLWSFDQITPVSTDFADGIDSAEQSFGSYSIVHLNKNKEPTAWGRYQFTKDGLQAVGLMDDAGNWINPAFPDAGSFLSDPPAQDAFLARLIAVQDKQIGGYGLRQYLGQEVDGIVARFPVTEAGMQAAAHRWGSKNLRHYLEYQAENNWVSDFSGLGEETEAKYRAIETRLRTFSELPLRSRHYAPALVTEMPVR